MANGYCLPILDGIEAVTGTNPAKKLSPLGFTQMMFCCQDGTAAPINNETANNGHEREVRIKYRTRPTEASVSDTPSACDTAVTPAYNEFTLPNMLYREYSLFVPDSLIRQYCKDASDTVNLNNGGTPVMREVYEMFIEGAGAVLRSINAALVLQMSTQFGKNLTTGNANAVPLTFSLGTPGMGDALIKLISDWRENELCDDVCMVGSGDFANFDLVKEIFNQGDQRSNLANILPRVWFDKDARTIWGNNQIGVFEKGSVALISRDKYVGDFARPLANSTYFNMALPMNEFNCPVDCVDWTFDIQLREIDCPADMAINGGVAAPVGPGVQIVISKNFQLFVRPSNLYDATDPLNGTNGTLRYTITGS